jgi:hypothetical protein
MTSPWVKPGEMLGYAQRLKKTGQWPPKIGSRPSSDKTPATPFIVIPVQPNDAGVRPIVGTSWINSPAIRLLNTATRQIEDRPRIGTTYKVVVDIENRGAAPVLGGFAEFYVGDPIWIDNALGFHVGNPEPDKPKWLGVTPFSLGINKGQLLESQKTWTPTTEFDLNRALFVRAFDPLGDKLTTEWDSWADRHVARRDLAPDFSGTWSGTEFRSVLVLHHPHYYPVGTLTIRVDAIPGMQQKAPFKTDGSYPSGVFECHVTVTALPNIVGRTLNLSPINNVQYQRGALQWLLFSTGALDLHAIWAEFKLTQQTDGHLYVECRWGPDQMSSVAGHTHATLSRV